MNTAKNAYPGAVNLQAVPPKYLYFGLVVALFQFSGVLPANAATLRIEPYASIQETYTDNVRAVNSGAESDLITEAEAGYSLTAQGGRLNLIYELGAIYEQHLDTSGLDNLRFDMLGSGDVELVEDILFVDADVNLTENTVTRGGARSATDRALPSNRTTELTYRVAPRIQGTVGRWASVSAQYDRSETKFLDPAAGTAGGGTDDQLSEQFSLNIGSGPRFSRLRTDLALSTEKTQTDTQSDLTEDRAELSAEYQATRQFSLIARAGLEDVGDSGNSAVSSDGPTWSLGGRFTPNSRLNARAEVGRRFDESNVSVDVTYQISPFFQLNTTYDQTVRTQQQTRADNLAGLIANDQGQLIDPITGNVVNPTASGFDIAGGSFREDAFRFGLFGTRGRNSYNFGVDVTQRETGGAAVEEEQVDASLSFTRRMRRNMTGNIGFEYSDVLQSPTPGSGDTSYEGTVGIDYTIGEVFTSRVEYTFLIRDFETGADFRENAVVASIRANF